MHPYNFFLSRAYIFASASRIKLFYLLLVDQLLIVVLYAKYKGRPPLFILPVFAQDHLLYSPRQALVCGVGWVLMHMVNGLRYFQGYPGSRLEVYVCELMFIHSLGPYHTPRPLPIRKANMAIRCSEMLDHRVEISSK